MVGIFCVYRRIRPVHHNQKIATAKGNFASTYAASEQKYKTGAESLYAQLQEMQ